VIVLVYSTQIGQVFLHLAVDSLSSEIQRNVNSIIKALATQMPQLTNCMVCDVLMAFLSEGKLSSKGDPTSAENQHTSWSKCPHLSVFLLSTVSFGGDLDLDVWEELLAELVIIAHHNLTCLLLLTVVHCFLVYLFVHLNQVELHVKHGLIYAREHRQIPTISSTKIWTNCSTLF
jgi:hypothetical protein